MKQVYILGGEQTDFERNWSKEGKSIRAMFKEVLHDGLSQANLDFLEIKRLNDHNKVAAYVGNFNAELYLKQNHLGAFLTEVDSSFFGVPAARYEAACASGSVAIDAAMTKIQNGDYDLAIVIGIEMMKTVDVKVGGDFLGLAAYYEKEAKDISFPFPTIFGKLADEIVLKYRFEETQFMDALGKISAMNYSNAKNNPKAQTRQWFMEENHSCNRGTSSNPIISGRLAVTDCSQVTDGAAVIFLASKKYAKEYCQKNKLDLDDLPRIKGWGHRVAPFRFDEKIKDSKNSAFILKWTREAVNDAYKRANLRVDDIDFFETHDCFTSSEFVAISSFGITEPGKEMEAINNGMISFQGTKPINPSGGLIGVGHPVGATGVRMMLDLYKQVSGKAYGYQVSNSKNGLMLNIGGSATTNYVFIVGK